MRRVAQHLVRGWANVQHLLNMVIYHKALPVKLLT